MSAACSISVSSRPPRLSSASRSFGRVASARASSSFFRPAAPRPSTGTPCSVGRLTVASASAASGAPRRARCRRRGRSTPRPYVVEDRQLAERPRDLEGAGDAEMADLGRHQARDLAALEADRAGIRLERAGDQVEDRALARAVRPDQAEDLALGSSKPTSLTAVKPPKRLVRLLTSSTRPGLRRAPGLAAGHPHPNPPPSRGRGTGAARPPARFLPPCGWASGASCLRGRPPSDFPPPGWLFYRLLLSARARLDGIPSPLRGRARVGGHPRRLRTRRRGPRAAAAPDRRSGSRSARRSWSRRRCTA